MTPKAFFSFAKTFMALNPDFDKWKNTLKYSGHYFRDNFNPVVNFDPISIGIYLTYKCNLTCSFCYNLQVNDKEFVKQDMTVEEVQKVLDHPQLKSSFRVAFVGGESLLHKDLFKCIDMCRDRKKLTVFASNGLLIPDRIDELKKTSLDSIQLSLYDGKMDKQIDNIRLLKKYNSHTMISFARIVTTEKKSYLEMEEYFKIAQELEVKEIIFQNYWSTNEEDSHLIIYEDNKEVVNHIEMLKAKYDKDFNVGWPPLVKRDYKERFCYDLYSTVFINKEGLVSPCCRITSPSKEFGTIWDEDFWNNDYFVSHRKDFNDKYPYLSECENCYHSTKDHRQFI
jgi:MoaA/NifB/PqqE/SkfB family radical SAM enzyme